MGNEGSSNEASDEDRAPGSASDAVRVGPGSHVTLHYRIAVPTDGGEHVVADTFPARPATLQVGAGQMAAPLEECLLGLAEGDEARFDFPPGAGYGVRSPELVQTLSRAAFDSNADTDTTYAPGDVVEFNAPDGRRFSGVLKDVGAERVVVDFNHPLAGVPLSFAVRVIGVLE